MAQKIGWLVLLAALATSCGIKGDPEPVGNGGVTLDRLEQSS